MDFNLTIEQQQIREEIKKVCKEFPDAYWRKVDSEKAYPDVFVKKLGDLGWLAALIPEEFGGTGLGITHISVAAIDYSALVTTTDVTPAMPEESSLFDGLLESLEKWLAGVAI